MSEERHNFSEPRPVPGLELPTWEIDVFRNSVPEPILTMRVNDRNLPPRRSKKKKIVWKLPDSFDQVPRFGIEEKKRLMDLFKNLKKERRKSKRGSATGFDGSGFEDKSDDDGNEEDSQEENKLESDLQNLSLGQESSPCEPATAKPQETRPSNGVDHKPAPPPGLLIPSAPPGLLPQMSNGRSADPKTEPPPPPLPIGRPDGLSSPPPPGLTPVVPTLDSGTPSKIEEPPLLNQQHLQPKPPPLASHPVEKAPTSAPLPSLNTLHVPSPMIRPARFLKYPTGMHPDIFGLEVANLYTGLLQSGHVEELMLYYTLTAQKSLSLKSAKSICQTPQEMKTQLQSLVGCVFAVQGVTVQHSLNNLLLIWSGLCQLQGQNHGFCHTIVLNPLPSTTLCADVNSMQYQIQNDALVLLTYD